MFKGSVFHCYVRLPECNLCFSRRSLGTIKSTILFLQAVGFRTPGAFEGEDEKKRMVNCGTRWAPTILLNGVMGPCKWP